MKRQSALSSALILCAIGALVATFPACSAPPIPPPTPPPPVARVAPTATASATEAPADPPPQSSRFAVATENATATKIAMDVLRRGGNAVDAAIAGVLAAGVAQPVSSGLGGGGFALVYDPKSKTVHALDFRESAPVGLRPIDYSKRPPPQSKRGVMIGVPGEAAGLFELHKRYAKLAFADDAKGAIETAENGFPVSAHVAKTIRFNESWLKHNASYGLFAGSSGVLAEGATTKNPGLAATLKRLAAEGVASFYEGAIGKDVVDSARAAGSHISAQDLSSYRVIERAPLHVVWEGHDVFTMPAPSGGGLLLAESLRMHDKAELASLGFASGAYEHVLAETFRGAVADRMRNVGDPDFIKADLDALASVERMKRRRATISLTSTTTAEKFALREAGTHHLVFADADGMVVSITTTVNNMFGSKVATAGGFVLNDQCDDFTPGPMEKRYGFASHGPNAPKGGARPVSSMTPAIVLDHDAPVLAIGGSGGTRIATGVTQVLLAHLAFDRPIAQAVADARIETPPAGGLLLDGFAPEALATDLRARGEVVDTTKANFSAIQAIAISTHDGARLYEAASDPRKGGDASVE